MAACLPYLFAEIDAIQPRVIVALGATAARGLTGETDAIGRLRGCVRLWRNEIPLIITYHPSYLLRSESLSDKRKVWEDMLLAMEILNLPVTEKHRTYFRTAR
jgi:DNA polymerase